MTNLIETKLKESGIPTTGIYSTMVKDIKDSIETVKMFGKDYWLERTCAGIKVINIVLELAK